MSKDLPGATADELILATVEAQDFPIGGMHWTGARIFKIVRAARRANGMIVFVYQNGVRFERSHDSRMMVVCGAKSDRLVGRLAFYQTV